MVIHWKAHNWYASKIQVLVAKGTDKIFYKRVFQHCVYTQDPNYITVIRWLKQHDIPIECHLARTRFWIPAGTKYTEFVLRWGDVCPNIDHETDHALGR